MFRKHLVYFHYVLDIVHGYKDGRGMVSKWLQPQVSLNLCGI